MGKLRLGVLGAGAWAVTAHLPALAARADEIEFVGICSKDGNRLSAVQDRFGFSMASDDYRDVIDAGIDICVVASPAATHYEFASAALESGAHVLCEKPMTVDPREAWRLVDLAEECKRQLLISFGWNYQPIIRAAKELLDRTGIGHLEQMTVHMSSQMRGLLSNGAGAEFAAGVVPERATWIDPARSGGGYAQAQLSHALGLALHLVPERVAEAFAFMYSPAGSAVELHDAICVRFDGGGIATVAGGSSHDGAGGDRHALEVRAIGSDGQLLVDIERECVWLFRPDGVDERLPVRAGDGTYDGQGPANALVDVACGRIEHNCAPGELGARTTEALALAYRSAASGVIARRQ